jgi:hypothetical protein
LFFIYPNNVYKYTSLKQEENFLHILHCIKENQQSTFTSLHGTTLKENKLSTFKSLHGTTLKENKQSTFTLLHGTTLKENKQSTCT